MSYTSIKIKNPKQRKTFSQKVAVFLAAINALLLILATIFSVTILSFAGYFIFTWFIIFLLIYILGIVMFVGYVEHACGNLGEDKVWGLWIGTILCSLSAFVITRWFVLSDWFEKEFLANFSDAEFWQSNNIWIAGWMLWLVISFTLACLSLYSDELDYRKIRNSDNVP